MPRPIEGIVINDNGHDFRVVPVVFGCLPNVSHWAESYSPAPYGGVLFEPLNGTGLFSTGRRSTG